MTCDSTQIDRTNRHFSKLCFLPPSFLPSLPPSLPLLPRYLHQARRHGRSPSIELGVGHLAFFPRVLVMEGDSHFMWRLPLLGKRRERRKIESVYTKIKDRARV